MRGKDGQSQAALRIAAVYILVAALWIVVSGRLVGHVAGPGLPHHEVVSLLEISKGLGFVLVSGILLYFLVRHYLARLLRSERLFHSVFESIADGVLLIGVGGNVVNANRAAMEMFGVSSKRELLLPLEELSRRFSVSRPDGKAARFEDYASGRAFLGETVHGVQVEARRPGGEVFQVGVAAAPVREGRSSDGQFPMVVVVLRDITEVRRLQRMRDEFLSTAAHELKTPLAVIKSGAELLLRFDETLPKEKKQVLLRTMDQGSKRMNYMVQELLDTSRLALDRLNLRHEVFDLSELAEGVVERMRLTTQRHRLAFERKGGTRIAGDPVRMEQVIQNLIDNAIKFSPRGGEIRVTIASVRDMVEVSVADQGVGIPEKAQGKIFERYFQASPALELGGMGIGLNLARQIIERHGGTIRFMSQEGRGSVFTFRIPLLEKGQQQDERAA